MDAFLTADGLIALITLTFLEVVLGVDNVIFISILSGKLPHRPAAARARVGLLGAMGMRMLLLMSIAWIIRLTAPLFTRSGTEFRDAISSSSSAGCSCSARRRSRSTSGSKARKGTARARSAPSFGAVITQIMLLDIVFSLDSVITAVGMADDLAIMVTAVVLAVAIMMFSAEPISAFVDRIRR